MRMRKNVLKEILQTEEEYVEDLNIFMSIFLYPLRQDKDQLSINDHTINRLFSNVEMLKPLHDKFCADLQQRFSEAEEKERRMGGGGGGRGGVVRIGDVFTTLSSFFKMYVQYCVNFKEAVAHQEQLLKSNKKIAKWFEIQEQDERCKSLGFGSWAIKPVQRLCKYPLLLRELLAHTPEGHIDHESIKTAKEKIGEVVEAVNAGKGTAEKKNKVIEIQNKMDGLDQELVAPSRFFVKEGKTEVRHKITGNGENRHLFLFNDLVVIARPKGSSRYEFRKAMLWAECRFIVISEQGKVKHGFEIAHQGQRYIFSCQSKKEQDEWVANFKTMTRDLKLKQLKEAKKTG